MKTKAPARHIRLTVAPEDAPARLDVFLAAKVEGVTRSGIKRLIDDSLVLVEGRPVKASHAIKVGENIEVGIPLYEPGAVAPEAIPLDIVYEDRDIIVINKPAGLAAHPGAGRQSGTLVNALAAHSAELSTLGGPLRAGIVHRLDKDTTGVLVAAKNDSSHISLSRQFKERTAVRRYLALVWGSLRLDEGTIDIPLGRDSVHRQKISTRARHKRGAVTTYRVVKRYPLLTLLELRLKTGRTHQIRVHLNEINHPVAGDQVYGRREPPPMMPPAVAARLKKIKRQLLHAGVLGITHPSTGEYMEFTAPPPPDMAEVLDALERLGDEKVG